jgi:hypothetical protein
MSTRAPEAQAVKILEANIEARSDANWSVRIGPAECAIRGHADREVHQRSLVVIATPFGRAGRA